MPWNNYLSDIIPVSVLEWRSQQMDRIQLFTCETVNQTFWMFLIQRIRPGVHRNALNCQILDLNILTCFQSQICVHSELSKLFVKNVDSRASLVAQWLRVCLPMQGTWVRALVREDPTCRGATGPRHHSYWACALELASHNCWGLCAWSPCSAMGEAIAMKGPHSAARSGPCSPQLEKARVQQRRPNAAKKKKKKKNIYIYIYIYKHNLG